MLNKSLLKRGQTVAVALSGGKDSVCLLDLLLKVKDERGITVKAVNVEHGIRGDSSLADSAFVKDLCLKAGVQLRSFTVSAPEFAQKTKTGLENAARILRYECFDAAINEGFADVIATAHHLGDDTETILLNLFRGSSLSGMTGIKEISSSGKIIRPILSTSKEEIDEYVIKNHLTYVTDESNFDDTFNRNYLRNSVVPIIKSRFPTVENSIARFAATAAEESALLDKMAMSLVRGDSVLFTSDDNSPLFRRACLAVIKRKGITKDYEKVHLDALLLLKDRLTGAKIQLPRGLTVFRGYNCITFEFPEEIPSPIPFVEGINVFGQYEIKVERKVLENAVSGMRLDLDKLPYNTVIRTKLPGDTITSFGGVRKSLKKYLTDKKIESRVSARLPLIACGNEIYAVIGVDISDLCKLDDHTATAAVISYTKRGETQTNV